MTRCPWRENHDESHLPVCQKEFAETELIAGHGIRHEIEDLIRKDFPDWDDYQQICKQDFNVYRARYVSSMIEEESGSVKDLATTVLKSINENELIATNINTQAQETMKVGDLISDKVATFGAAGSSLSLFLLS